MSHYSEAEGKSHFAHGKAQNKFERAAEIPFSNSISNECLFVLFVCVSQRTMSPRSLSMADPAAAG